MGSPPSDFEKRKIPNDHGGRDLPAVRFGQISRVLEALAGGSSRSGAAAYAGIHRTTLQKWMAADPKLVMLVEEAEDKVEPNYLGIVAKEALGNGRESWKAAAWLLERRMPHLYGQRREVIVSGDIELRIERAAKAAGFNKDEIMAEVAAILSEEPQATD